MPNCQNLMWDIEHSKGHKRSLRELEDPLDWSSSSVEPIVAYGAPSSIIGAMLQLDTALAQDPVKQLYVAFLVTFSDEFRCTYPLERDQSRVELHCVLACRIRTRLWKIGTISWSTWISWNIIELQEPSLVWSLDHCPKYRHLWNWDRLSRSASCWYVGLVFLATRLFPW